MKPSVKKIIINFLAATVLLSLSLFSSWAYPAGPVFGQDSSWTKAINLSNMGSSSNPAIVVDDQGTTHVFWNDTYVGTMYSSSPDGLEWTAPVSPSLPFGETRPVLLKGPDGFIHAFWVNASGNLLNSFAKGENLGVSGNWKTGQTLAFSVRSFDVTLDQDGVIHLAYIRVQENAETPAGVFYRKSIPGGTGWAKSETLLFTSSYFRSVDPGNSHVKIAVSSGSAGNTVFVTWDERPRQRVYLDRSLDGGETWLGAAEIDRPDAQTDFAVPLRLDVFSWENQTLLVWEKGRTEGNCSHRFQVSTDQGETWSLPGNIIPDTSACAQSSGLVSSRTDMLVWNVTINGQVSFVAWNGSGWSEPQIQTGLISIQDPETLQQLTLGCQQTTYIAASNTIAAVGCDLGGREDIWYTSLPLGDIGGWFLSPANWQRPVNVMDLGVGSSSYQLLADHQGNHYSLWIQPVQPGMFDATNPEVEQEKVIYISGQNEYNWTPPVIVLKSTADGGVDQMTAAINANDQLLAVWRGKKAEKLYFSNALASKSFSSRDWSEPVILPNPAGSCSSPDIQVGLPGEIYVTFSVPLNEGRGIYLTRSDDDGKTWMKPVRIFDAAAEEWDMVGDPKITRLANGQLHVFWMRGSISDPEVGSGMFYARSDDRGETWSKAESVVDRDVLWGDIIGSANGLLYRVWQEPIIGQSVISSQMSADGGLTWALPLTITNPGEPLNRFILLADSLDQVHLVQISYNQDQSLILRHWVSNQAAWTAGENIALEQSRILSVRSVAGSFSPTGELAVVYSMDKTAEDGQVVQGLMKFTNRMIDPQPVQPVEAAPLVETPAASAAVEETVTAEPTATPQPQPTHTPTLIDLGEVPQSSANSIWAGLALGVAVPTLIVGVLFGYSIFRSKKMVRDHRNNR